MEISKIPESWKDVSLSQYIQILNGKIPMEIFSGLTIKQLRKLSTLEANTILQKLQFLQSPPEFEVKNEFETNGKVYKIFQPPHHPFAIHIDLDRVMKDYSNKPELILKVLATVCIPNGKEYLEEDTETTETDLLNAKISDIYGIFNFFLLGTEAFQNDSQRFISVKELITKKLKLQAIQLKIDFIKNGHGLKWLSRFVLGMYVTLILSLVCLQVKSLDGFSSKGKKMKLLIPIIKILNRILKFISKNAYLQKSA